jgi:hypothetical protein
MLEKHVCTFCGNTGSRGAQWTLTVDGDVLRVHKPCGEKLAASAPEGTSVKLAPSKELRDEWRAKRDEREVREFWAKKAPNLVDLRDRLVARDAAARKTA